MHEDLKTASEIKIHHSLVVSWKPRISWNNRHFSALKYTEVSIPVTTILVDLFLAKHNVEYSMSSPRRDKGCTPLILVRLLRQINGIKPCG